MDSDNKEGMCGNTAGVISYLNFDEGEGILIKLVSRPASGPQEVHNCKYDPINQKIFMTSCGETNAKLKMFTSEHIDYIHEFCMQQLGQVVFVSGCTNKAKNQNIRLIGYRSGVLRFVSIEKLESARAFQLDLDEGETLTCGFYQNGASNFGVGTSHGNVYLCSLSVHRALKATKLCDLTKSIENAVTSMQLSSLDPFGNLLVCFDNG